MLGGILALLVGVAGWYYLFYSKAAARLEGVEGSAINQRRQRLRRTNGAVMVLMAALLYAGSRVEPDQEPQAFVSVWLGVLVLFFVFVVLGVADIRLTARLRRKP
jgi:hypothetical protein